MVPHTQMGHECFRTLTVFSRVILNSGEAASLCAGSRGVLWSDRFLLRVNCIVSRRSHHRSRRNSTAAIHHLTVSGWR